MHADYHRALVNRYADQMETSTSLPLPLGQTAAFDHFLCSRNGVDLTGKAFPGRAIVWVGWGKLNQKCKVTIFFSGAEVANSYKHVFG